MRALKVPALSLVVLVGPSGSGKSTFAKAHFKPGEVLSSDAFRAMVRDDENDQSATADAFDALKYVARKRLAAGRLTVIDATNVQPDGRVEMLALAREFHALPVAIVFDVDLDLCFARNKARPDRQGAVHFVRRQHGDMRRSMAGRGGKGLLREGFRIVHVLSSQEDVDGAVVVREPLWCDQREEKGPFDLVGDVHGCRDELDALLAKLGYTPDPERGFAHPEGRRVVFLGDLVDRGPRNLDVLRLVMAMCRAGTALCVPGNHDMKLLKWLRGRDVRIAHGMDRTVAEFDAIPEAERAGVREEVAAFLDDLVSHLVLDGGRLVVAHAGMKATMQGRGSGAVRDFALYGETTGEVDEYGLPVRHDWAAAYRGEAAVVYGHTPTTELAWVNRTLCVDTGCVFGGDLTALRYPEMDTVQVRAAQEYYAPARPLDAPVRGRTVQHSLDDVLDLDDVSGRHVLTTRLAHAISVRPGEAAAALEAVSRFAHDPRWLVYLPPTMSPPETSQREGTLEHPDQAFSYFRDQGVTEVICEEKHMGSRAVIVVCRDAECARARFGVTRGDDGAVLTRTGRSFFDDASVTRAFLDRVRAALTAQGFWSRFESDWFVLDAEIMPWSAKAQELLRHQYAAVGAAARASCAPAVDVFARAAARGVDAGALADRYRAMHDGVQRFVASYRRYCWPVDGVDDLRVAPFHLLAAEGHCFVDRDHRWHMDTLAELARHDPSWFVATRHVTVDLRDAASAESATAWWEDIIAAGAEGMVVKPMSFIARGRRGLVQPAVKVRGREYLRIIYGPTYDAPEHLARLRQRGLSTKRSLALREFALGVESLERFVRREALRRVHECAFAVLALESEAVDPRL